jgi:hypothetical protein
VIGSGVAPQAKVVDSRPHLARPDWCKAHVVWGANESRKMSNETNRPDWLQWHNDPVSIGLVCRLDEVRARFEVRDLPGGWLVLNVAPNSNWLRFAVLQYAGQVSGEPERASLVFYGDGPGGKDDPLRECRHTYWGEGGNGYIFYPQAKLIAAALEALGEFYDLD